MMSKQASLTIVCINSEPPSKHIEIIIQALRDLDKNEFGMTFKQHAWTIEDYLNAKGYVIEKE